MKLVYNWKGKILVPITVGWLVGGAVISILGLLLGTNIVASYGIFSLILCTAFIALTMDIDIFDVTMDEKPFNKE